jgi:hypothetical protein
VKSTQIETEERSYLVRIIACGDHAKAHISKRIFPRQHDLEHNPKNSDTISAAIRAPIRGHLQDMRFSAISLRYALSISRASQACAQRYAASKKGQDFLLQALSSLRLA